MTQSPTLIFDSEAVVLRTASGPAWVVDSCEKIPQAARTAAFATRSKDFRYYEVLEETLSQQFDFRYLILRHEATGAFAVQPLFFVEQDLLAGLPMGIRSLFNGVRKVRPGFLKMRMMMIGCAGGEGELDHDQPWVPQALFDALEAYRAKAGAFIIL